MGVYFNSAIVGNEKSYLEDHVTESAYTPDIKGVFQNILDIERNYNAMMEAVGIAEIQAYANGEDLFMNEASVDGFFAKVKEFFKMVWKKIQEIFNKFLAFMSSLTMSDKDFVKKWKVSIMKANTKDFSYKGYKFTISDYSSKFNAYVTDAKRIIDDMEYVSNDNAEEIDVKTKNWTQDKEDKKEELRGKILGDSKKYTTEEFHNELFEKLRNGQSSKETIETVDVSAELKLIEDYKTAKKDAETVMKTLKNTIDEAIKDLEKSEKEFKGSTQEHQTEKLRNISARIEGNKAVLQYAQEANGMVLSALKQQRSQAKMICVKLVGRKESAEVSSASNFFDVEFK